MRSYVVLCEIEYENDQDVDYAHRNHIAFGPFRTERMAANFMLENIRDRQPLMAVLSRSCGRRMNSLDDFKVVELKEWTDVLHEELNEAKERFNSR